MSAPTMIEPVVEEEKETAAETYALGTGILHSKIMPQSTTASRTLTMVMTVMCYLACLALGSLIVINKAVDSWTSDISSQITVQIKPVNGQKISAQISKALAILNSSDGIKGAEAMTDEQAAALLEPWLGKGNILAELPVPRMITVGIDSANPPNLENLGKLLKAQVPGATLDTHQQWQSQITRTAGTLQLIGFGVLVLISLTTVAIVVFATRSALASNHEIVEVLHLVGAYDNFIAMQVQWHFLKLGLKAGIIGGIFGALTFLALSLLTGQSLPGSLNPGSVNLIAGPAGLSITNYLTLLFVPVVTTIISVGTARAAVMRILAEVL